MRILVTGSRDWTDEDMVGTALAETVAARLEPHTLIHGCARGLDRIASIIADCWDWEVEAHAANWEEHGKTAGPIRNTHMLSVGKPDICLAFPLPGSKGTWDMIRKANRAGLEVRIYPDGAA